jgi:L-lactate dehydrogenase
MNVQIIGMGRTGSSIAFGLLATGTANLVFCDDIDRKKLYGEIQDLKDAVAIFQNKCFVFNGFSKSCDVYIITAGFPRKTIRPMNKRMKEKNIKIVSGIMKKIPKNRLVIIVTNPSKTLSGIFNAIEGGEILDKARKARTKHDPEKTANSIIRNKGYTNWGITAEIIYRLKNYERHYKT